MQTTIPSAKVDGEGGGDMRFERGKVQNCRPTRCSKVCYKD